MKHTTRITCLVIGLLMSALVCGPVAALSADDLLSRYLSPSGDAPSTSPFPDRSSRIDEIIRPADNVQEDVHYYTCPPDTPIGKLHRIAGLYWDIPLGILHPNAVDDAGRLFIVTESCPCAWAEEKILTEPPDEESHGAETFQPSTLPARLMNPVPTSPLPVMTRNVQTIPYLTPGTAITPALIFGECGFTFL